MILCSFEKLTDFTRRVTTHGTLWGHMSLLTSVLTDNGLGLVAVDQFPNEVHLSYIRHHT